MLRTSALSASVAFVMLLAATLAGCSSSTSDDSSLVAPAGQQVVTFNVPGMT